MPPGRAVHAGHLSLLQLKVMSAIEDCRTAALGGHVEACEDCGQWRIAYNTCRNRLHRRILKADLVADGIGSLRCAKADVDGANGFPSGRRQNQLRLKASTCSGSDYTKSNEVAAIVTFSTGANHPRAPHLLNRTFAHPWQG